jgi:hypothetical protein
MSEEQVSTTGLPQSFEESLLKAFNAEGAPEEAEASEEVLAAEEAPAEAAPEEESAEEVEEVEAKSPEEEAEEKAALEETKAFNQLGKKAQGRIRELVAEKKEYSQQLETFRAEQAQREAQYQQYLQQMAYQAQAREQQLAAQLERYEEEMSRARAVREEEELKRRLGNDPVKLFEHELLSKAEKLAEEKAQAKYRVVEERLQKEEQARAELKRQAERQQRFSKWEAQLKEAVPNTVLKGVDDKESISRLAPALENFLLAYSASGAQEPAEAAKEFDQIIDQIVDLRVKARAKAQGQVVAKNKNLPAAGNVGSKSAASAPASLTDRPAPPKHLINEAGFSNVWEWRQALKEGDDKARSLLGAK